ncbi:MAG: hypothetical protein ACRC7O_17045 [Fimbriiglobus sp.]
MNELLTCTISILSIAAIYFTWQDAMRTRAQKRADLNQRVAHMLWAAAQKTA